MPYHAIATLTGSRTKPIANKSEQQMLTDVVIPFLRDGTMTARFKGEQRSYQVLEMRIYETPEVYGRKNGISLADHVAGRKNQWRKFRQKAEKILAKNKARVFFITPIQGEKTGDQEQQRIRKEFDDRFEIVETIIGDYGGVAIRIDREHAIEDLVTRIKREIRNAKFVIADLTDERPSCYFEAGFAEALKKPVLYIASQKSVIKPGTDTRIHFDIHMNYQRFSNLEEMKEKLLATIEKNKEKLFYDGDLDEYSEVLDL